MISTQVALLRLPITYADVVAYMELFGTPLEVWEKRTIMALDMAVLPIINQRALKGKSAGVIGRAADDTEGIKQDLRALIAQAQSR